MTPELRARLRDAAGKATPGDWHVSRSGRHVKANIGAPWICEADCGEKLWRENMAFIALAQPRNTLSILDALDAAEKERNGYKADYFRRHNDVCDCTEKLIEAEARATAAEARVAVLEGALEPFANMAGRIDPRLEGRGNHYVSGMISDAWLLSSDFQRALAAKLEGRGDG